MTAPTRGAHPDAATSRALASLRGRAERQHFDELGPRSSQPGCRRHLHDLLIDDRDDRAELGHCRVCIMGHDAHTIGSDRSFDYSVVWSSRDENVDRSQRRSCAVGLQLRDESSFRAAWTAITYWSNDRSARSLRSWGTDNHERREVAGANGVILLVTFRSCRACSRSPKWSDSSPSGDQRPRRASAGTAVVSSRLAPRSYTGRSQPAHGSSISRSED